MQLASPSLRTVVCSTAKARTFKATATVANATKLASRPRPGPNIPATEWPKRCHTLFLVLGIDDWRVRLLKRTTKDACHCEETLTIFS